MLNAPLTFSQGQSPEAAGKGQILAEGPCRTFKRFHGKTIVVKWAGKNAMTDEGA